MPVERLPGIARSRAAASAVMLLIVPPLVNEPAAAGKPRKAASQSMACRSSWVARPGVEREVDVVRVREEVGEGAHLEPARADVGEVAGTRLGERGVEHVGGEVEVGDDVARALGQVLAQPGEELGGGQRLLLAGLVELAPGAGDEGGRVLERRLALVAEGEGTGHVS